MKIYIGADHNGHQLKKSICEYLKSRGFEVVDEGNKGLDPKDDFPVFAARVVNAMRADKDFDPHRTDQVRGLLICGSGQGMVMAANRFSGIRAGLVYNLASAKSTRHDEDSNVIALPSELFKSFKDWQVLLDAWLSEPFGNAERFRRRNQQLDQLDKN